MTAAEPARVTLEEGVVFGTGGGRDLRCDVFTPPANPGNAPAILLVHGGAWVMGDAKQLRGYGFLLGREGYVCVATEYRLAGEAPWPAQIHDVKACLRWMRANAVTLGIDPNRIAVMGASSGGHLALMCGATQDMPEFEGDGGNPGVSTAVQAVVSYYGITEIEPGRPEGLKDSVEKLMRDAAPEAYTAASPLHYPASNYPPTVILHSNRDKLVPRTQSLRLYEHLLAAGIPCELHMFDGIGHMFDGLKALGRQSADIVNVFLGRFMATPEPAEPAS
jgi:acetyl esterase/lipase